MLPGEQVMTKLEDAGAEASSIGNIGQHILWSIVLYYDPLLLTVGD